MSEYNPSAPQKFIPLRLSWPERVAFLAANGSSADVEEIELVSQEHQLMRETLTEIVECTTGLAAYTIANRALNRITR